MSRRLLHISDIHFGPKHLPPVAAGLARLVEERLPDLVVLSGDQTQRAKPRQFRQARQWVNALPVPVLSVPGNHDVPMYRFWERIAAPYGAYRRHYSRDLEPVWHDEDLIVVGLNTAHGWTVKHGRILPGQLARLRQVLEQLGDDRFRVVVAHHPLAPAPDFRDRSVVRRAAEACRELARLGVHLVLSGHLHIAFLQVLPTPDGAAGDPVALLHAGTAASSRGRGREDGRNTCNWIRVDSDAVVVQRLAWQPDAEAFAVEDERVLPRGLEGPLTGQVLVPS
ncbi:MAG: metallophosphoesterase family protein [Thermoanaerobaculia bacterium]